MENLKSIEIKDISKYKKEIINNKLVITQTINNLEQYEQELDQDNDILYLKPKIVYSDFEKICSLPLKFSKIISTNICKLDGELITDKLKYRKILIDIWKSMTASKILQNTTMNIKLGEHNEKGYNYCNDLKFSFQDKDSHGTLKEISKMIKINNYKMDLKIQLGNGNQINFRL